MAGKVQGSVRIVLIVFILMVVFFIFWFFRKQSTDCSPDVKPIPVSTVRPERRDLSETLILPAILETRRIVDVIPRVPGLVLEVLVHEGDTVREEDILARIDSQVYRQEFHIAESAWTLAEESLARIQAMYENSGISRQQWDVARADRDAAFANYELAKIRLEYTELRSPLSGRILKQYYDEGNLASIDRPLFTIGDDSNLQVKVGVPEKYWNRFSTPTDLRVFTRYSAMSETKEAEIRFISPTISYEDRSFEIICDIPQRTNPWPVGARVEVVFVLSAMNETWSLPLRARLSDSVWMIDENLHTVSALELPIVFQDSKRFAVPAEWAGSLFVLDGHAWLKDGSRVIPYEADLKP